LGTCRNALSAARAQRQERFYAVVCGIANSTRRKERFRRRRLRIYRIHPRKNRGCGSSRPADSQQFAAVRIKFMTFKDFFTMKPDNIFRTASRAFRALNTFRRIGRKTVRGIDRSDRAVLGTNSAFDTTFPLDFSLKRGKLGKET